MMENMYAAWKMYAYWKYIWFFQKFILIEKQLLQGRPYKNICCKDDLTKIFVSSPRPGELFFQSEPAGTLTSFFSCLSIYSLILNIWS